MFTILKVIPYTRPRFFWQGWFQKTPAPELQRVDVRGGAFFYIAQLYADKNGSVDFNALLPLGGSRQRLLPCGQVLQKLPEPFRWFKPTVLPGLLFMNTALRFLKTTSFLHPLQTIGIADENAVLCKSALPFASYAKEVRVYTAHPERYAQTSEEMLEAYGLPLVLSNTPKTVEACEVQLWPFQANAHMSPGRFVLHHGISATLAGTTLTLPSEQAHRCPPDTDALLFASALYELCNDASLGTLCYDRFLPIKTQRAY